MKNRNRTSARELRNQRQNRIGYLILVVVGLLVAGFVVFNLSLTTKRVRLDPESMCPVDGPRAYTVILIDGSDAFSPIQRADLKRYFDALRDDILKYSQVAIYAPQKMSQEKLLSPALKICNPGDAQGVSGIVANPVKIQLRYEEKFAKKVNTVLDQGLATSGANTSPVMEMIQAVAVDGFPVGESVPKRMIIVSDMLQNTDWYSHYSDPIEFSIAKTRPAFQHVYTDLTGVTIEVLYIGREGYERLQTNRHGEFWDQFFQHMNGNLRSISRIGG